MKRLLALAAVAVALFATPAFAANCPGNPYTLQNGQLADANQVMANFNNLLNCSNNNLAKNGANSDITSLSGLTTPLSVSQGGTGNTTGRPSGVAGGVLAGTYPNPAYAPIAANTFVANATAGSAAPTAITGTVATTKLNNFVGDSGSGGTKGLVPAPASGDAAASKYLGAGGTWSVVPSPIKAWAQANGTTGVVSAGFNIASVTAGGSGSYTFNFTTPLATANYAVLCTANSGASFLSTTYDTLTVNSFHVVTGTPPATAANATGISCMALL